MHATIFDTVEKLSRLEKLELARYLLTELAKEEQAASSLTQEEQAELERRWIEIESDATELLSGEQFAHEIKSRYGWEVSLP
jgi:putative addiction module component (TIGR02574 family)